MPDRLNGLNVYQWEIKDLSKRLKSGSVYLPVVGRFLKLTTALNFEKKWKAILSIPT